MFKKRDKKDKRKKSVVDKVVMGAIIGGAIGSVVGITVAPKSGKETRQDIIEAKNKFVEKHGEEINAVKQETKKHSKKVWDYFKKLIKRK